MGVSPPCPPLSPLPFRDYHSYCLSCPPHQIVCGWVRLPFILEEECVVGCKPAVMPPHQIHRLPFILEEVCGWV